MVAADNSRDLSKSGDGRIFDGIRQNSAAARFEGSSARRVRACLQGLGAPRKLKTQP